MEKSRIDRAIREAQIRTGAPRSTSRSRFVAEKPGHHRIVAHGLMSDVGGSWISSALACLLISRTHSTTTDTRKFQNRAGFWNSRHVAKRKSQQSLSFARTQRSDFRIKKSAPSPSPECNPLAPRKGFHLANETTTLLLSSLPALPRRTAYFFFAFFDEPELPPIGCTTGVATVSAGLVLSGGIDLAADGVVFDILVAVVGLETAVNSRVLVLADVELAVVFVAPFLPTNVEAVSS